jgi:response regulator of citrate/malate metabolism
MSQGRSELLLESLTRFYEDSANFTQLQDILTIKSQGISLRNLEWFVTNYAKNRHVTYNSPTGRPFTVHVAYKSSLDGYSKKLFDPFCRTERIQFKGISTTVAQLNFIKWCLTNGIIDYMIKDKIRPQNHL